MSPRSFRTTLFLLAAIALLGYWTWRRPLQADDLPFLLIGLLSVAPHMLFPTRTWQMIVYPCQGIALGLTLLAGPTVASWALVLGMLLGALFSRRSTALSPAEWRDALTFNLGLHLLAPGVSALPFSWMPALYPALPAWQQQLYFAILLIGVYGVIQGGRALLHSGGNLPPLPRQVLMRALIVHFLPLPFVGGLAAAYHALGWLSLVLIGGLTNILSILGWGIGAAQVETDLRRQEIQTIERVGQALRDTLALEPLLTIIHEQVTRVMGIDNFYVALLDASRRSIWYPLAVKHGVRRSWPRRPLADRLTDRVILNGEPILLPRNAGEHMQQIGLPAGEDAPSAWLGVPLIRQGTTFGCLAVFATAPDAVFDIHNLELLSALSGQISVAIQNALLFQQEQQRAAQLEQLTQVSATMAATLDPAEVMSRICQGATQVCGATAAAVFHVDIGQKTAYLSHATGLPLRLQQMLGIIPLSHLGLERFLGHNLPHFVSELNQVEWNPAIREALKQAGFQAAALFPLSTSQEQVGMLALWFQESQPFPQDTRHLMQTFAAQAALVLANARMYARTDTALSRRVTQLSILETVGRELAAAIHSDQVFALGLQQAMEFTRSTWGVLSLWNPEADELQVHTSLPSGDLAVGQPAPSLAQEAFRQRRVIRSTPGEQAIHREAQAHISVPLIYEGRALGVISLESRQPASYSAEDETFLAQLANQVAIALVNARLYRENEMRLERLRLLFQTSMNLSATTDTQAVVTTVAQSLLHIVPQASIGAYLLQGKHFRRVLVRGLQGMHFPEEITTSDLGALVPMLTQTGPFYLPQEAPLHRKLQATAAATILVLPLQVARHARGLILLQMENGHPPDKESEQLMRTIATQGALALHNAQLFNNVREVRDRLVAVLNSVGDGVMMVQEDGRIALANARLSAWLSLPLNQLIGRRLQELPPEVLQALGYNLPRVHRLLGKMENQFAPTTPRERYHITRDGQEMAFERTSAPVLDERGAVIGWVLVFRDITDEVNLNRARELIADTLVHDLRSPLSAIISALDLIELEKEVITSPVITQSLSIARRSANRLANLVQSLLEISRMESGILDLEPKPNVDLGKIVREVVEENLPLAMEHGLHLRAEVAADLPPASLDESKIARVIINLVDNALKFTPEGGHIIVRADRADPQHLRLQVRDTGPGIPQEFLERIFDRFVQVPGRRGRRRGVGLGLTFSRLVVEAHGGTISARNHPEGGAEFTILLPLHHTPQPPDPTNGH